MGSKPIHSNVQRLGRKHITQELPHQQSQAEKATASQAGTKPLMSLQVIQKLQRNT